VAATLLTYEATRISEYASLLAALRRCAIGQQQLQKGDEHYENNRYLAGIIGVCGGRLYAWLRDNACWQRDPAACRHHYTGAYSRANTVAGFHQ